MIRPTCSIVIGSCLMLLSACASESRDEVARVTSPDGRLDAVVVELNPGATSLFSHEVHLVTRGRSVTDRSEVAYLYGAQRNKTAAGVNVRWVTNGRLSIEFLEARKQELEHPFVALDGEQIQVEFHPGISDPAAPSGGMLYNLLKHRVP